MAVDLVARVESHRGEEEENQPPLSLHPVEGRMHFHKIFDVNSSNIGVWEGHARNVLAKEST